MQVLETKTIPAQACTARISGLVSYGTTSFTDALLYCPSRFRSLNLEFLLFHIVQALFIVEASECSNQTRPARMRHVHLSRPTIFDVLKRLRDRWLFPPKMNNLLHNTCMVGLWPHKLYCLWLKTLVKNNRVNFTSNAIFSLILISISSSSSLCAASFSSIKNCSLCHHENDGSADRSS